MISSKAIRALLVISSLVWIGSTAGWAGPVTGGCRGGALGPAHDVPGAVCEDFDTDRNGSGSIDWTRLYLGACPTDPLLGAADTTDDILGHAVTGGATPLGVDGQICSADAVYTAAQATCHVVPTENDWHLHSPYEECDPSYDPQGIFAGTGHCGPLALAHSGYRSLHLGRHLNATNTLYDTYRLRQTSAFVMDPVELGTSSTLTFWHIIQVCDDTCTAAGNGGTTAGGQVQISVLDPATGTYGRWQRLTPTENGYNAVAQSVIIVCEFDPGDDQLAPLDETMCSGSPQWSDIGDFYGSDRTCTTDTDHNDPANKDCGETTNRTVDTSCSWVADPSCGSFLENGTTGPGVWARSQVDLTPFASQRVRLRWIFEGGGGWGFGESRSFLEPSVGLPIFAYDQDDGWYVDDIRLTDIQENPPDAAPVADAGPDQSLTCTDFSGTTVALDGSGSSDADGDPLVYQWRGPFAEGGGTISGASPTVTLQPGTSTLSLTVSDCTESSRDSLDVLVGFGVDGFRNPLAALVPEGDTVPLPSVAFRQGRTLRLKFGLLCGATQLTDQEVAAPEIVQLNTQGGPPIDLGLIGTDYLFSFSNSGLWSYSLDTTALAPGIWEITILMPDGTRWVGGFELK